MYNRVLTQSKGNSSTFYIIKQYQNLYYSQNIIENPIEHNTEMLSCANKLDRPVTK